MAVVGLCVVAAGCGTVKPVARSHVESSGPTAAGNRAAARAEAARLLALAQVPSGATRLARPPRSLSVPVIGPAGTRSQVDRVRSWRVPLPFGTVRAWLLAHPPKGLRNAGAGSTGNSRSSQIIKIGDSYSAPASKAWQSAELDISSTAAGPHATVIRADAAVVWLDPVPVGSGPGRHPARVTLASGCPRDDQGVTGVTNPGMKLTRRLLPPGQPTAGLRCGYHGLNGRPWQLSAVTHLNARAAEREARSLSAIPLGHPDGEVLSCPADDDSSAILVLAYPGHRDVDLWIHLEGCGGVSNGYIGA